MEKLSNNPKIAIIHDWLVTFGGAENLLLQMIECFPDADLFCTVENLPKEIRVKFPKEIRTTFIQKLPFSSKFYWYYSPLMPIAIEQLDLSCYDLVISSSHAFAKGIIAHPNQLHISYVHSSPRFAWDLQFDYYRNFGFNSGVKKILAAIMFHKIRNWDSRTTNGVDILIANSKFVQRRIQKCYRRNSELIYPGINTDFFTTTENPKEDFYLAGSFMNPFKKLDLIIETFTQKFPDKKLLIFGNGPQEKYLRKIAGKNIVFKGRVSNNELKELFQQAKAYIFAATEDFGMIMAESQSSGSPVIAYKKGGASEIVIEKCEYPTGILFDELSIDSLSEAINNFEENTFKYKSFNCRNNALRFSTDHFKATFYEKIRTEWEKWNELL